MIQIQIQIGHAMIQIQTEIRHALLYSTRASPLLSSPLLSCTSPLLHHACPWDERPKWER